MLMIYLILFINVIYSNGSFLRPTFAPGAVPTNQVLLAGQKSDAKLGGKGSDDRQKWAPGGCARTNCYHTCAAAKLGEFPLRLM